MIISPAGHRVGFRFRLGFRVGFRTIFDPKKFEYLKCFIFYSILKRTKPDSNDQVAGRAVFNLFENVVQLTINQRQNDPAQAAFRDMLMSLRNGLDTAQAVDVYNVLRSQMIGIAPNTIRERFRDAVNLHHSNHSVERANIEKLNSLVTAEGSAERMCRINAVF